VLLDTRGFLWAIGSPTKLPAAIRHQIDETDVFVSAASIWEVSIKSGIGKLKANAEEVLAAVEDSGFTLLPISGAHAARVSALPAIHTDPFDRMLIAQAMSEPMILLTSDAVLSQYGSLITVM
jgi:PIN domain nuclease of toxin-antitoxin system